MPFNAIVARHEPLMHLIDETRSVVISVSTTYRSTCIANEGRNTYGAVTAEHVHADRHAVARSAGDDRHVAPEGSTAPAGSAG